MTFKTKILLPLLICFLSTNYLAQTSVAENLDSLQANPTKYLTPMQYAFMFHEETPWMIKGSLTNTGYNDPFYDLNSGDLVLGFERRIKGALTANVSVNLRPYLAKYSTNKNLNTSLRYYYTMKARKEKESIPFNLSGNYIEAGVDFGFYKRLNGNYNTPGNDFQLFNNTNLLTTYFVKWGMQRRYLKNGFVDMGIMASHYVLPLRYESGYSNLTLNSTSSIGFAFAKDKKDLNKGKLCSVIKCYEEQKSALKLNVSGLLNVGVNKYFANVNIQPKITYERKLGKSIFSINNTVQLSLAYNTSVNSTYLSYGAEVNVETRMYYNLRRRIQKGKTGNGLSANYISFGILNKYARDNVSKDVSRTTSTSRGQLYISPSGRSEKYGFLQPQIATGIQRFVGDHFYYDLGISYLPNSLRFMVIESNININTAGSAYLYSRVGYRF